MPDFSSLARLLIIGGITLAAVGTAMLFADRIPGFGRLPGDIVIKRGNFTFYAPIATMLVLSILLNILLRLFRR